MCGGKAETVWHIMSGCGKLAQTEFKKRHDVVARIVHWNMCGKFGPQKAYKWYGHEAAEAVQNE